MVRYMSGLVILYSKKRIKMPQKLSAITSKPLKLITAILCSISSKESDTGRTELSQKQLKPIKKQLI
jgi:hypothetical protein